VGFFIALALLLGLFAVGGAAFFFKKGADAISHTMKNGKPVEEAAGVFLVSSNISRKDDDIVLDVVLTNSSDISYPGLFVWADLTSNGDYTRFTTETLRSLGAHAQEIFTITFEDADYTNSISDLRFKLEFYQDPKKE
jgi:hypothetical protein